jgi:DNA-binding MarR family transcriptional regulator
VPRGSASGTRTSTRRSGPARPTVGTDIVRIDPDFADEFPEADPLCTEAYVAVLMAGDALDRELSQRIEHTLGVSHIVFNALAVIDGAGEPLTPSQISERMLISSATMTSMLDVLERRGWIKRMPNPDDRRSVLVQTTDDGRAIADEVIPGLHRLEKDVMDALTARERTQLVALLSKVIGQAAERTADALEPLSGIRKRPARLR